jgi:hypothetical protein
LQRLTIVLARMRGAPRGAWVTRATRFERSLSLPGFDSRQYAHSNKHRSI